jgi:hypothetical protein
MLSTYKHLHNFTSASCLLNCELPSQTLNFVSMAEFRNYKCKVMLYPVFNYIPLCNLHSILPV